MSRDNFGIGPDTSCTKCGCPCGYPCSSCGNGMAGLNIIREQRSAREVKPLTEADRQEMKEEDDAAMRARDERDELREHYQ